MPSTSMRFLGAATAAALLAGLSQLPVAAVSAPPAKALPTLEQATAGLGDVDVRGLVQPSAAQKSAAAGIGGAVRWNQFGTPASISPVTGTLGKASSTDA